MKKLLYIALSLLIFSCNPETVNYTTGADGVVGGVLNGRVNSYSIKTFNATSKFGEPVKGDEKAPSILIETKTHIYNENGDLKERHTMDGYKIISDFDDKGIKTGYSHYDNNGDVIVVRKYELDEQGNIIQSSSYDTDGNLNYYTRNLYNENGENYESIQYDDNGDLSRKTERIYGDSGNLIERIEYDKDERISSKYTFTYDSISEKKISQKLFKISVIYKKNKPVLQDYPEAVEYKKPCVEVDITSAEGMQNLTYYTPDGEVHRIKGDQKCLFLRAFPDAMTLKELQKKQAKEKKEAEYAAKLKEYLASAEERMSLVYEKTYAYNDRGDLILEKKNNELKEYKYDYDENDNWVVKYDYLYGKIKYISERTIEYYK